MRKIKLVFFLTFLYGYSFAQSTPPFWNEIVSFKKSDSSDFPPKHSILFVGSSSFRMWTSINTDFSNDSIINRGFGGSTLPDVVRYFYDIIYPYSPYKIFIYCGENDLAAKDSISAAEVFLRFRTLYCMIRQNFPSTIVNFVSIKPSPSRKSVQGKVLEANSLIKDFLKDEAFTNFIDVYHLMVDGNGNMKSDIYRKDLLHMNKKGYALWIGAIRPYLTQ